VRRRQHDFERRLQRHLQGGSLLVGSVRGQREVVERDGACGGGGADVAGNPQKMLSGLIVPLPRL
jgi:hypothetical protein